MLKDSIKIGKYTIKNRLVMPPMATATAEKGAVTEKMVEYYRDRARGGAIGIIFTEHAYIARQGMARATQLSVAEDADMDGLRKLADVIQADGSVGILQMNHAGSAAFPDVTGLSVVSASPVIPPTPTLMGDGTIPQALKVEEIHAITGQFAAAAVRAKKAGFAGVEIHSAHAYLLNQFYSPLTNKRTDDYGGSIVNRIRFHREVIDAVRKAVGDDYLVSLRLGGCDYMDGGSTIEDCVYAARAFEQAGIDMLSLSGGMCRYTRQGHEEAGYFRDMSKAVKQAISIPVLLTGGVTKAAEAENLLADGAADLIGVGRAILKDAHWADEQLGK